MPEGGRARRGAGDDERGVAGAPLVLAGHRLYDRARALAPEDGDGAAAAAARDLRAVEARLSPGLADEPDQFIRPRRAEAAGRVALVRLVHQPAQLARALGGVRAFEYLREARDARVLFDRVLRRLPDVVVAR